MYGVSGSAPEMGASLTEDQERQARLVELEEALESVVHEMWSLHAPSWKFALGRRIVIRLPVNSQLVAQLFVLYNLLALVSGILLILLGDGLAPELGIALVVGALFSIGAFASAVWVLTVEGERAAVQKSFGVEIREQLEDLRRRRDSLIKEIEILNATDT